MRKLKIIVVLFLLVFLSMHSNSAAVYTEWIGADDDWFSTVNWTSGVPTMPADYNGLANLDNYIRWM